MLCLCAHRLKFWFQTDLGRENSVAFDFSHHGHALRPIFMLWLVKIWQSFVSTCDALNCLFPPDLKMKYSCYQESPVIHGWFVFWDFGWGKRRLSKSEIRFGMAPFSFSPRLMRKSLKRFWPYLSAFRSCISNGKPQ